MLDLHSESNSIVMLWPRLFPGRARFSNVRLLLSICGAVIVSQNSCLFIHSLVSCEVTIAEALHVKKKKNTVDASALSKVSTLRS